MPKNNQPAREKNIDVIVSFFESGIETHAKRLGIELEHTLLHADGRAVSYSEPHGTAWLLGQLRDAGYAEETRDAEGDLLGVAMRAGAGSAGDGAGANAGEPSAAGAAGASEPSADAGGAAAGEPNAASAAFAQAVTIEPAAQVELSAGPFVELTDAARCFEGFEAKLDRTLSPTDVRVLTLGYHPTSRAADLELIPKRRYELMNRYLGGISPFGVCMMRGSASTQVSIDYTSVDDCLRKLRLAFALVPLLALLCDNAPAFEGAPRTHELVRTEIWKHCDPDRCGIVPGAMQPGFTLRDYAEYVLDTPAILAPDAQAAEGWREDARTFGEIYAERPMSRADVEHALSMFFTDVRLKTYIEIRPADAMPVPYVIAYAALIKGLFYGEGSLDALDALFAGASEADVAAAKESLMARGYEGEAYGRPVGEVMDDVMGIARVGLSKDDRKWLAPLEQLAAERTTLARKAEGEEHAASVPKRGE